MRRFLYSAVLAASLSSQCAIAADLGHPTTPRGEQDAALKELSMAINNLTTIRSAASSPWLIALDITIEIAGRIYDWWSLKQASKTTDQLNKELAALRIAIENEQRARSPSQQDDFVVKELRVIIDDLLRSLRLLKLRTYRPCKPFYFRNSRGACIDARSK